MHWNVNTTDAQSPTGIGTYWVASSSSPYIG